VTVLLRCDEVRVLVGLARELAVAMDSDRNAGEDGLEVRLLRAVERVEQRLGGAPDAFDQDPRRNTATTLAGPVARLLCAPNFVNFHLEHHFARRFPRTGSPACTRCCARRAAMTAGAASGDRIGRWSSAARCRPDSPARRPAAKEREAR